MILSKINVGRSYRFQCFGCLHPSLYDICSDSNGLLWIHLMEITTDHEDEDRRY